MDGYVPAEMHEDLDNEIGVITLDSSFSPIRKVAYAVEQARVGQMTNYDKLIIEVFGPTVPLLRTMPSRIAPRF